MTNMRYFVLLIVMMFMPLGMYGQTGTQPAGNGVAGDPYLIGTAEELLWYALRVNDGYGTIEGKLINDIDYSMYNDQDRYMIGNQKGVRSFNGVFDGDGYTITIGFNFQNAALDCVGLFAFVDNATIKNLNVDGTLTISGQWWHVGSIVGGDSDLDGKTRYIKNCTSSVVITATKEKGTQDFVSLGGIIGCSQKGTLYMEQCGFLGNIISTSKATDNTSYRVEIGGLAGLVKSGHIYESYVYVDDSSGMTLTDEGSKQGNYFYPLVGNRSSHSTGVVTTKNGSNQLRNCFFAGKVNGRTPTKNSYNPPFQEWPNNINKDYPNRQPTLEEILAVIDSKATDMYIRSTADMQRFANAVNGGNRTINGHLRKCIEFNGTVGGNIDNVTRNYSGTFDGNNHTITINRNEMSYGLFDLTLDAVIQNLNLSGSISGNINCGSYIYRNVGDNTRLINCINKMNFITGTNSTALIGGFVYYTNKNITFQKCAYIGTIEGKGNTSACYGFLCKIYNSPNILIEDSYANFSLIKATGAQFIPSENAVTLTNSYSTDKTPEQYASGEVCHLLNGSTSETTGPWYQNIGTEPNPVHAKCSCPEHAGENKVVYKNDHKECPGAPTTHHSTYNNIILTGAELFDYPDHKDVDFAAGDFNCSICGDISLDSEGNYLIYNDDKLRSFAGEIEAGNMYNAKVLCNFSAGTTTTVGSATHPYAGTFDGGYNTITLQGTPLFDYVSSATIKNLLVAGTVESEKGKNNAVGSIVADNINQPLTLESCISTVLITKPTKGGKPTVGGLIGNAKVAGWSVSNCGFAGSFNDGITKVSGIVGNPSATGYIRKSIVYYQPSNYNSTSTNYNTFAPTIAKLTDCYYNRTLGTATRSGETKKTADEFKDGTVRNLLNGVNNKTVWYHYGADPGLRYPTIVGYVWTGATDSNWSKASNWKKGKAPVNMEAADETITIPAVAFIKKHYPTISSNVNINNLHIDPSAAVNIPAADITVNVNGTITNQGTFTVNYGDAFSSVNGAPNLVISGASPKGITVNRTVKQDMLYYMGSATAEGTINEGYNTGGDYLAYFNAPTLSFVVARSEARFPVPQYVGCTVGLRPYGSGDVSIKQIGTIHNSENIPVHCVEGWNWLSNPYPYTAKTWDSDMRCGLLPELSDNMRKTVWVRRNIGGDKYTYATYNAGLDIATTHGRVNEDNKVDPKYATEDAKYIAPFQDYCIYVNTTGDYSISGIPAGSKYSHLKSASLESLKSVIRLNVLTDGNDIMDDQAVLVLREDGILGVSDIDSHKYTSSSLNQIHIHKHNSNNKYAIALYPSATDMEGVEIPMTVTSAKGTKSVTIAADLSEYIDDYDVILIDHKDQTEINLSTDSYDLSASDLSLKRFSIVLRKSDVSETENTGSATSIDNTITNRRFIAYTTQSNIIVELGSADEGSAISIIDLMGREVTKINNSSKYNIIPISQKGVYIVVMNDKSQKVIVK
ncbi:MAG: T9SS type A sorting domain-containing protein [Bacteroidales bacterium]|nr:T9SS type A sorting domain-containing protein [Bacteroidales bacterium]